MVQASLSSFVEFPVALSQMHSKLLGKDDVFNLFFLQEPADHVKQ